MIKLGFILTTNYCKISYMSIEHSVEKINPVVEHSSLQGEPHSEKPSFLDKIDPFYSILLILVIASIFFALGRLSALSEQKGSIKIIQPNGENAVSIVSDDMAGQQANTLNAIVGESAEVIGSKSGKKYYFPWCGTVKRIKPENQVKFASIEEAKKAGFTAGGNCKGLE